MKLLVFLCCLVSLGAHAKTTRIYGKTAKEIYYKMKDVPAVKYGSTIDKAGKDIRCSKSAYIYDCYVEINGTGEVVRK